MQNPSIVNHMTLWFQMLVIAVAMQFLILLFSSQLFNSVLFASVKFSDKKCQSIILFVLPHAS
jgi:hypothetical protein